MRYETDNIVAKFASAMAAAASARPESMRKAAQFIRSPVFDGDPSDHRRSAINAFAQFLESNATKVEQVYRATYGGK